MKIEIGLINPSSTWQYAVSRIDSADPVTGHLTIEYIYCER
jgi:hypothetical protein